MPYQRQIPQNEYEKRVQQAGYNWFSTSILGRPGAISDHLDPHQHHSQNTHLIVDGQLTITRQDTGQWNTIDANTWGARKELKIEPFVQYRGNAGPSGCVFVEGHVHLSPTTATRFEQRGHLTWVSDGRRNPVQWCQDERRRELQRGARVDRINTRNLYW